MIGYNERREAENLLALLLQSRQKLTAFNAADEDIAAALPHHTELDDALLAWYLPLAAWAANARDSGEYALCFTPADKVQRMPYDLLARLPLREEETGALQEHDSLFAGLEEGEAQTMRRLYHRLLGILPMRMLLERLLALAALENKKHDAARLKHERLRLLHAPAWRAEIPLCQERRSGTTLQVQDHDFTIIDRLIDNRGKNLREDAGFALPVAMMERTACAPALMTTAIALKHDGDETPSYQALPCGHMALGVYGTGTPESFFEEVLRDQQRRPRPVLRVRSYGQMRLMQVDDEAAQLLRKTRYDAAKAALPMEERKLFGAQDRGGRRILPQLTHELQSRYEKSDEECMCAFFKGEEQIEVQRVKAMRGLRTMVEAFFSQEELPRNFNNDDPALFINVGKKKLGQRTARLLIAHAAGARLLAEDCPEGKMPQSLAMLLDTLERDPRRRSAFLQDVRGMGDSHTKLNVRYEVSESGVRRMLAVRSPSEDLTRIESWLQEGGTGQVCFTGAELAAACTYGLHRFLYYGQEVGTGAKQGDFSLAASTGSRRAPDVCFQLLCLWCAAQNGGAAELHCDGAAPEKSFFRLRNGDVPFVDLLAEANKSAFTPAAMAAFVPHLQGLRLKIARQKDGYRITC